MNAKSILCLWLVSCLSLYAYTQSNSIKNDTISLPITFVTSFGPFYGGYSGFKFYKKDSVYNDFKYKMLPTVSKIPLHLTNIMIGVIDFNPKQWVFQNYIAKKINKDEYDNYLKNIGGVDTSKMSPSYIKCFVSILMAEDENKNKVVIVDQNNNLDFRDDKQLSPEVEREPLDSTVKNFIWVYSERLQNNKIVGDTIPLSIFENKSPQKKYLRYSIPQYAKAIFETKERNYVIDILPITITKTYSFPQLAISPPSLTKIRPDSLINLNELIYIDRIAYRNLGVDLNRNLLILEKQNKTTKLYSTAIGYYIPEFSGSNFLTHDSIILSQFKGKYLFIDFWGTWCSPCLAEIPNIKNAYKLLKDRVSFLGIIANDTKESLMNYLHKYNLPWPQILSNAIADQYRIFGFPTNFLVDPNGKIIAKDLRGEELANKTKELITENN